jgi:hypothetical protein|tara:strand:+ start:111 stop:572 length:462 start_codon:yes stop_codon:yes gene_type:complete
MADISSYPIGTPSSGDMVPGTQVTKDSSGNTINLTKNFTVDSIAGFADATAAYTSYVALLTQTSGAPVATVVQNTTGATFTWSYVSGGTYEVTASSSIFTANKTLVFNNNGIDNGGGNTPPQWSRTSSTVIRITTGGIDNAIQNGSFEIRIYT